MEMRAKKDTCFVILPGFDQDNTPVLKIQEELERLGYTAVAKGFWGGDSAVFSRLTIEESTAGVTALIKDLKQKYTQVVGIGISLGGALLLEHAKKNTDLAFIVSVGTPFRLKYKYLIGFALFTAFPFLSLMWRTVGYNSKWLASRRVVRYLNVEFTKDLSSITTPTLFLQSTYDYVVRSRNNEKYIVEMQSTTKEQVFVPNTNHIMECNGPIIISHINEFCKRNSLGLTTPL